MRLNFLYFVEIASVVLAGLSSFVEKHVWTPAYTYYLLLVLVVLDVLTNNLVVGKPLRPRNLALRLGGYTVVLALAHGFGGHEKGLFFLKQLVLAPFVLVHMRRLIISLGKLDLVDNDVAELLSRRITRQAEREPDVPAESEVAPAPPLKLSSPPHADLSPQRASAPGARRLGRADARPALRRRPAPGHRLGGRAPGRAARLVPRPA